MEKRKFRCSACGNTFTTASTEDEVESEFQDYYGHRSDDSGDETVPVCDSCYEIIINGLIARLGKDE